jgi:hypothetical protein
MLDGLTITIQYRDSSIILSNRRLMSLPQVEDLSADIPRVVGEIASHLWEEIDFELEHLNND